MSAPVRHKLQKPVKAFLIAAISLNPERLFCVPEWQKQNKEKQTMPRRIFNVYIISYYEMPILFNSLRLTNKCHRIQFNEWMILLLRCIETFLWYVIHNAVKIFLKKQTISWFRKKSEDDWKVREHRKCPLADWYMVYNSLGASE